MYEVYAKLGNIPGIPETVHHRGKRESFSCIAVDIDMFGSFATDLLAQDKQLHMYNIFNLKHDRRSNQ